MQKVINQVLLCSALLISMPAEALIILQQASLPINVDYDSNLNLIQQKEGVWRYTSTPRYSLTALDEKNRWFGDVGLALQRSSNKNISADREDPSLNAGWQHQLERGSFSLNASYDKRSSRFTQFNTNALVDVDGTSVTKTLGANYTYLITERLNLTTGINYSKTAYTDSSFVDSTSKTANGSISYDLTEKISPFVRLSFTDFKPKGNLSQPSTSKNFSVGSTFLITPRWTFAPSIGVNSTSTSGSGNGLNLGPNGSASGSGWIADTSLNYLSEKSTFQATLSRSVTPGGLGNLQKSDSVGLSYSRELTQLSTAGINFNASKSQSDFDSEAMQLSAFYAKELSLNWQMRVVAGHRIQKQTTFSANNSNVGVSLIYNIPQF